MRSKILGGELQPGSRLPPVRELARQHKVSLTTAQRAYKVLTELGLTEGRRGAGTHVASQFGKGESLGILSHVNSGLMLSYERISDNIGLRSLATAVPDPTLFRAADFVAEFEELRRGSPWNWFYSPVAGVPKLRSEIAAMIRRRGLTFTDEEVLVTHGSTHALAVVLDELRTSKGTVLVQEPWFIGAQELFTALRLRSVGVPVGQDGLDLDRFESLARANPGAPAIIFSTFHPATGQCMRNAEQVLTIAARYGIALIEVDQYRSIEYEKAEAPLASMDSSVIYVDSFAYSMVAGIRLGYIAAPQGLLKKFVWRMTATKMSPSAPLQHTLAGYLSRGSLKAHLSRVIPEYKKRRDALLHALEMYFPKGCQWTCPGGGYATWVKLPDGNWDDLYAEAVQKGVAFTPSELLMSRKDTSSFRLAFSCQKPEVLDSAIDILSRLIKVRI